MYKQYFIHRNYLKQHMQEQGITIDRLVEMSGVSRAAIRDIRLHKQEPLRYTTQTLSTTLGVDEPTLFPRAEIVGRSRSRCGRKYVKVGDRS